MVRAALMLASSLLVVGAGCRPPTLYRWGDYDETLYKHYKNPADRQAFVEQLNGIIIESEKTGSKVPPGCYAEYGYALYEQGQATEAATWFAKERDAWPESRVLMTTMIKNAERQAARAPQTTPASATNSAAGTK